MICEFSISSPHLSHFFPAHVFLLMTAVRIAFPFYLSKPPNEAMFVVAEFPFDRKITEATARVYPMM
jgi:hypothetical protein